MKSKLGIQTVAYVTVTGNSMSLVFNADKLMSILKVITGAASKVNSTAATLNSVAEAQKAGGIAAFIDAEHAFDRFYAAKLGVDVDNLWISQPDNGEQALEIAEQLIRLL